MTEAPKSDNAGRTQEGWDAPLDTAEQRRAAIEAAFDYRGDVTIETTDGRTLEGYVFDRRAEGESPTLRMMLTKGGNQTLGYDQVAKLRFTGRDTAAGRSWENWVRRYIEKKLAGEKAEFQPVPEENSKAEKQENSKW